MAITTILLSDKVNKLQALPNIDNKDTVVQEIEALELFTVVERSSIFGDDSILWILKNYTIQELKDKAAKALVKPEVHVGDVVNFGHKHSMKGIVTEIVGENKDRLTIMSTSKTDINKFIWAFFSKVKVC